MKALLLSLLLLVSGVAAAQPAELKPPSELFSVHAPNPLGTEADFRGVTLATVPMLATNAERMQRVDAIRRAAALVPATEAIEVIYLPSADAALAPVHDAFVAGRYLDHVLGVVGRELALPTSLRVVMADCGNINASYLSGRATLVVCHEVVASFVDQFRAKFVNDPAGLGQAVVSATVFTTLHEVGHALIELLRLPIIGNEEDAADRIAAVYLLRDPEVGADRAIAAADAIGAFTSIDWDVHPMGQQRRYNIVCLTLGALNDPRISLTGEPDFNENRLPGCTTEFQASRDALDQLLTTHYRWHTDSPRLKGLLEIGKGADLNAPLAPIGGWRDPFQEGVAFQQKFLAGLQATIAAGGDLEACALFARRYIDKNRRDMNALRAVLDGLRKVQRDALGTAHIHELFDLLVLRKSIREARPDVMALPVVAVFFDLVPLKLQPS